MKANLFWIHRGKVAIYLLRNTSVFDAARQFPVSQKESSVLSKEVLAIPESVCAKKTYTLSRPVSAIHLIRAADGRHGKLGEISQLQPGARLDCCGDGYNARTTKVHYANEFYFVFLQDLYDLE
jgi:hypothetical protein